MAFKFNPFTGSLDIKATKAEEIALELLDGSKLNIQASSDELESAVADLDQAIGSLTASPTNYTPIDSTAVASHLNAIDDELGSLSSLIQNFEWQPSALDYITDNTVAPPTETLGDRYVLSHDGGAPNAAYDGASAGDIVEFDGTVWVSTTPTIGTLISIDDETTSLRQWGGSSWTQKFFESTTASGFLSRSGFDIQLTNLQNNHLIVGSAGNVATSTNTASLGDIQATSTGGLEIKAGAIVNADINAAAAIELSKLEALTADRALLSSGTGEIIVSAVTNIELGYLSGVTSAVQTQLDAKLDDFVSTTDNALVRTDGTTGEAVQDSGILIDDSDNMTAIQSITFNSGVIADKVLDEDDLVSDDAAALATQQSIKAYVDNASFNVVSSSGTFTATQNATHLVDTSGGVATVTLPAASANKYVKIKDASGNAFTNNITVQTPGAETIDGAASVVMDSGFGAKTFVSDGSNWFVL